MTLTQRTQLLRRVDALAGDFPLGISSGNVVTIRDKFIETPATADEIVKSMRAMYTWACERQICDVDPTQGVRKIDPGGGGAIPWTVDDFHRFRQRHPKGTKAYLALTLFLFTACRVGDVIVLGVSNEVMIRGVRALRWKPQKKGSPLIEIPMLPPLYEATRSQKVIGQTYLLTEHGKPYSSIEGFRNRFRAWCDQAGIVDRSPHGIRKAAGTLLAEAGCTQHQIMAVHGHTQAATSEIYTRGAERWQLASAAMAQLKGMEW